MADNAEYLEGLKALRTEVMLLESEIRRLVYGRKVRFKALLLNGIPRTGSITDVNVGPRGGQGRHERIGITIGVAIDRMDGRPGVLSDTWWGDLLSVEVVEE